MICGRRLWKGVEELFPERQLFIRSRGRVHFLTLSKRKQMALLVIPLVPVLVVTAGAISLGLQQTWIFSRDLRIATLLETQRYLIEERESLSTELSLSQEHYSAVTNRLERKHAALDRMLQTRTSLERRVGQLRASLIALETELRLRRADHASLSQRYRQLREQLTQTSYLRSEPDGSQVATPTLLRLSLGKYFEEDGPVATAPERPKTEVAFEATNRLLALTAAERDSARLANSNLETRTKQLENRLTGLQEMQNSLIARIESGTEAYIGELERVIKLTGLDVEGLLDRIEGTVEGIGGPLIGIAAPEGVSELAPTPNSHPESSDTLEDRFSQAINRMGAKLARWSALSAVAESLPLTAPVIPYRVTSSFGKRRDPFTKRWARHEGVDLAAPYRSPVLATAAGRVSFVGWKGPYGRMIEIDHGYGLKTRYGHLYRTYVKRGEKVAKRQRIAVIGSSGRSTGRHLHYEVHYDDRVLDPTTFLKAGDHVFKDRQE